MKLFRRLRGGRAENTGSQAFVSPAALDRRLTDDEDAALRFILHLEDFRGAEELRGQVPFVRAVWGRTTELYLAVDGGTRADIGDGRIEVAALVVNDTEEPTGFIHVWTKDGWLSSLEYSWVTDEMPAEYPDLDSLGIWDPSTNRPSADSRDIGER
jgi:hypothetical protein